MAIIYLRKNDTDLIVNTIGTIFKEGKELKQFDNGIGYKKVQVNKKKYYVHRLICEAYYGLKDKMTVNHINGNQSDNRLENLEWCTQSENNKHSYRVLNKKPTIVRNVVINQIENGIVVNTFNSVREACRILKTSPKAIKNNINKKFQYANVLTK